MSISFYGSSKTSNSGSLMPSGSSASMPSSSGSSFGFVLPCGVTVTYSILGEGSYTHEIPIVWDLIVDIPGQKTWVFEAFYLHEGDELDVPEIHYQMQASWFEGFPLDLSCFLSPEEAEPISIVWKYDCAGWP